MKMIRDHSDALASKRPSRADLIRKNPLGHGGDCRSLAPRQPVPRARRLSAMESSTVNERSGPSLRRSERACPSIEKGRAEHYRSSSFIAEGRARQLDEPSKTPAKDPRGDRKQRETMRDNEQPFCLVNSLISTKVQVTGSGCSRLLIRRFRVRFPGDPRKGV
jgi:hypothetical protein